MPCNQFCSQFGMWNFHFFCWKALTLTIERVGSDGLGGFSSREASEAGAPVSPASAWPFAFSISKIHVFINFGRPCFLSSIFDKANLVVLFWFTFCCHSSLLLCKFSSQGFSWCLLKGSTVKQWHTEDYQQSICISYIGGVGFQNHFLLIFRQLPFQERVWAIVMQSWNTCQQPRRSRPHRPPGWVPRWSRWTLK